MTAANEDCGIWPPSNFSGMQTDDSATSPHPMYDTYHANPAHARWDTLEPVFSCALGDTLAP